MVLVFMPFYCRSTAVLLLLCCCCCTTAGVVLLFFYCCCWCISASVVLLFNCCCTNVYVLYTGCCCRERSASYLGLKDASQQAFHGTGTVDGGPLNQLHTTSVTLAKGGRAASPTPRVSLAFTRKLYRRPRGQP